MALYREGKAAMAADGTVTGTGTKWQSSLSLIRPGATIMFLSSPIQMAVVNKVVSDTEIKAITTNGAVVASTDYAILLSDSLTVDGLAQDVAETLRYYQSQETEIADAVDFFKSFDFEALQSLADQVMADSEAAGASASAAAASEVEAKTSETNAKASEVAAESARDQVQQIINDAGEQSTLVALAQPGGAKKVHLKHGGTVQDAVDFITFDMWSDTIDKTGATSVLDKMIAFFAYASANNLKIKQSGGKYLLSGTGNIVFSVPYEFTDGCEFIIDNWNGYFLFSNGNGQQMTYNADNESTYGVLAAVNSSADLGKGSSRLSGISGDVRLSDHAVFMESSKPWYYARGKLYNWHNVNRISNFGYLDAPFMYDSGGTITSIYALPVAKRFSKLKGLQLALRNVTALYVLRIEHSSLVKIEEVTVSEKPETLPKSFAMISTDYVYGLHVTDVRDKYPNNTIIGGSAAFGYMLNFNHTFEAVIERVKGEGKGWGVTNGTFTGRFTYRDCVLNRIDTHNPVHEYLHIDNCVLGRSSISVVTMGELHIEDCIINETDEAGGHLVSTRGDLGGWSAGTLRITNLKIGGKVTDRTNISWNFDYLVLGFNDTSTGTTGVVAGSGISNRLFDKIIIDGIEADADSSGLAPFTKVFDNKNPYRIGCPELVSIRNVEWDYDTPLTIDYKNFLDPDGTRESTAIHPVLAKPTTRLVMENITAREIKINGEAYYHTPDVVMKNIKPPVGQDSVKLTLCQRGRYSVDGFDIKQVDAVGDGNTPPNSLNGRISLKMSNGRFFNPATVMNDSLVSNALLIAGSHEQSEIEVDNSEIAIALSGISDRANNIALVKAARITNCIYWDTNTSARYVGLPVAVGGSGATVINANMKIKVGSRFAVITSTGYADVFVPPFTCERNIVDTTGTFKVAFAVDSDKKSATIGNVTAPIAITAMYIL